MVWALPQPDRSSVHEFSVFADKPVVLIRESLFDAATSLNNVSALCPQFANELCESFAVIPRLHWHRGILLRCFWITRGHLDRDGLTQPLARSLVGGHFPKRNPGGVSEVANPFG